MPTVESWSIGYYRENGDGIDGWDSEVMLWNCRPREVGETTIECRALIMSEMIKWGSDSFKDGLSAEKTFDMMIVEEGYNISLLTSEDIVAVKQALKSLIEG